MECAVLPCYPCPHGSICCAHGTDLLGGERDALVAAFGPDCVVRTEHGWRTAVVDGACFFRRGNACAIHTHPAYPAVCREFPWRDAETGGEYVYDVEVCPVAVSARQAEAHDCVSSSLP